MDDKKVFKLPHVPHDAIIKIEVSGTFLKRCQTLLIGLGEQLGKEKLKLLYEKFKNTAENPADVNEAIIFILTALVAEIEKEAIAQNIVKEVEITQEEAAKLFGESTGN